MSDDILNFSGDEALGEVTGVDTLRVTVRCTNSSMFARATVGRLLSIEGRTPQEHLIAIVERAVRTVEATTEGGAPDEEQRLELRDAVQAVIVGTFKAREADARNVFRRGAETFPKIDQPTYLLEGANLTRLMNLMSEEVPDDKRLRLGRFVADEESIAVANGDRFFQRHAAVLGSTGSGKSWAVATILERASTLPHPNIIVLDMHGEYAPLTDKIKGYATGFKIAGPAEISDPQNNSLFLPYWLLNREEMASMFVDRSEFTATNQVTRVSDHVRTLKEECLRSNGQEKIAELFTVDSPVPYSLNDLREALQEDNTAMEEGATRQKQGKWFGQFSRLISRLDSKIADRRYGFMFSPPKETQDYGWLKELSKKLLGEGGGRGIKIIDFSETPSDVLPVVVAVLARLLYNVQFWMAPEKRTPLCFLCDEAHLYLPVKDDADPVQKQALGSFERIAKEGRKYGVSMVVVSQRPSDVSRTILSQCNNFLAMRLTNETDQGVVRKLVPDAFGGITDVLPLLDTGEAMMLGDAMLLPTRVRLDRPTVEPISATRRFWQEWSEVEPSDSAISAAVEALRAQTRL